MLNGTPFESSLRASNLAPYFRRPSLGSMQPANFGYAHFEMSGNQKIIKLGWINEAPNIEACQ
jgi:hypothetical protein